MATQKSKFAVGLFVACGIFIATVAVIWLGATRYLKKGQLYATYFNESVQGLDIDAPVKYRGVTIGRVESIGIAPDSKLIEVVMQLEPEADMERDMVAQLKSVGITGSMFIELDLRKKDKPDQSPKITFPTEYPIVPSKPSEIQQLLGYVDVIMAEIKGLDLPGISHKFKNTLNMIDQAVEDAEVKSISTGIQSSLKGANQVLDADRWDRIMDSVETAGQSLNRLMDRMEHSLDPLESALSGVDAIVHGNEQLVKTAMEDVVRAVQNANQMMEEGTRLVTGTQDAVWRLRRHLIVVAQNLEKATDNLNQLVESLKAQPSQLLFDRSLPPRKTVP